MSLAMRIMHLRNEKMKLHNYMDAVNCNGNSLYCYIDQLWISSFCNVRVCSKHNAPVHSTED